jgi:transcriptional regulator with XRE-family HTH domain
MAYIRNMNRDELKKWRQRNGYSQGQLAKVLGVDVMTVSRWERGVREIPSFLHLALRCLELEGSHISKGKTKERRIKR